MTASPVVAEECQHNDHTVPVPESMPPVALDLEVLEETISIDHNDQHAVPVSESMPPPVVPTPAPHPRPTLPERIAALEAMIVDPDTPPAGTSYQNRVEALEVLVEGTTSPGALTVRVAALEQLFCES
jgi:hypothetical protein